MIRNICYQKRYSLWILLVKYGLLINVHAVIYIWRVHVIYHVVVLFVDVVLNLINVRSASSYIPLCLLMIKCRMILEIYSFNVFIVVALSLLMRKLWIIVMSVLSRNRSFFWFQVGKTDSIKHLKLYMLK